MLHARKRKPTTLYSFVFVIVFALIALMPVSAFGETDSRSSSSKLPFSFDVSLSPTDPGVALAQLITSETEYMFGLFNGRTPFEAVGGVYSLELGTEYTVFFSTETTYDIIRYTAKLCVTDAAYIYDVVYEVVPNGGSSSGRGGSNNEQWEYEPNDEPYEANETWEGWLNHGNVGLWSPGDFSDWWKMQFEHSGGTEFWVIGLDVSPNSAFKIYHAEDQYGTNLTLLADSTDLLYNIDNDWWVFYVSIEAGDWYFVEVSDFSWGTDYTFYAEHVGGHACTKGENQPDTSNGHPHKLYYVVCTDSGCPNNSSIGWVLDQYGGYAYVGDELILIQGSAPHNFIYNGHEIIYGCEVSGCGYTLTSYPSNPNFCPDCHGNCITGTWQTESTHPHDIWRWQCATASCPLGKKFLKDYNGQANWSWQDDGEPSEIHATGLGHLQQQKCTYSGCNVMTTPYFISYQIIGCGDCFPLAFGFPSYVSLSSGAEFWHSFTPSASGHYTFSTTLADSLVHGELYLSQNSQTPVEPVYSRNTGGNDFYKDYYLTAGTTYYFKVEGSASLRTDYILTVELPLPTNILVLTDDAYSGDEIGAVNTAGIAFLLQFGIHLVPIIDPNVSLTGMPFNEKCKYANDVNCDFDVWNCGLCKDDESDPYFYHSKSGSKNFLWMMDNPTIYPNIKTASNPNAPYNVALLLTGRKMCVAINGSSGYSHTESNGVVDDILGNYAVVTTARIDAKGLYERTIQHEIGHLLGCWDSYYCTSGQPCIMKSNDFREDNRFYLNIWCNDCWNTIDTERPHLQ